jgi:flagellin
MSVNIADGADGLSTIRNVSLLKRSLDKTRQRLSPDSENTDTNSGAAELRISEQMRAQIGTLTSAIRDLEENTRRSREAEEAIAELREQLLAMREVAVAATDRSSPAEEAGAAYQDQIDRLAAAYNQLRAEAVYDGQRLLDGSEGSVTHISPVSNYDVSEPRRSKEAVGQIDESVRGLDKARARVGIEAEEEYQATVRSLEVSSQNLVAAESLIRDSSFASEHARYTRQIIELNAGVAALAQGNLASGAVFKLLHT